MECKYVRKKMEGFNGFSVLVDERVYKEGYVGTRGPFYAKVVGTDLWVNGSTCEDAISNLKLEWEGWKERNGCWMDIDDINEPIDMDELTISSREWCSICEDYCDRNEAHHILLVPNRSQEGNRE